MSPLKQNNSVTQDSDFNQQHATGS